MVRYGPRFTSTIQDALAFFDASVANGSLVDTSPRPRLVQAQLAAMRWLLDMAAQHINAGRTKAACYLIGRALQRCHGEDSGWLTRDWVKGDASPELARQIGALQNSLGWI